MGSVGNQNPWQTYDTYKDCSQGICSIYCPQWCYIIFPPPPPFTLRDVEDGGSGSDFSPLIIAVIGILASAFILVSYYTIISKYCRRRRGHDGGSIEWDEHHQHTNESWQGSNTDAAAAGLDESVIKSITVCKYKKGDGFVIDGSDCPVCLTEFQENETLRLLPKCSHAFHLPCIDTWLKSQATCPLCRANIASAPTQQPRPPENQETPASTTAATTVTAVTAQQYQQHRSNDSVLVIQDLERFVQEEAEVNLVPEVDDGLHFNLPKPAVQDLELSENMMEIREDNVNGIQLIRRSVSLNSSMCHNQMSIADILRINEDDDDETIDIEKNKLGILNLVRSPLALKRSMSTGRFMFITRYETGRSSGIPN